MVHEVPATSTHAFFDNGCADFTPPPEAHDRSNVETGELRDMFTLTFSTACSVEKLSAHSCPSKCSSESGPRILRCSKPHT